MRIVRHYLVPMLVALSGACHGPLPPTQPPPRLQQDVPETTTNDGPTPGPLAVDAASSGGTNLLPIPNPIPSGSSAGGSASTR